MALGFEHRTSAGWLLPLRLAAGVLLLWAGVQKARTGFDASALLAQLIQWRGAGDTFGFFQQPLSELVTPRAALIARLVTAGEIATGALLLLGLFTRAGGLVALLLGATYFLASQQAAALLTALIGLAVMGSAAGRPLGLDGVIKARLPRYFLG